MIIGIDPGITGAVAFINAGGVTATDTPSHEVKSGKKTKQDYLPAQMAGILAPFSGKPGVHCFIEKVGAMPGQGVTSMFNFGKGFGLWLGILSALKIPFTLVTPQVWKKEIMQGMGDKDAARIRAQQLFPAKVQELSRKKDIGRADAILIAEYGRRTMGGGQLRITDTE